MVIVNHGCHLGWLWNPLTSKPLNTSVSDFLD